MEAAALKEDITFYSMNGYAFSSVFKTKTVEGLRKMLGTIDGVIYSLAAQHRTDKEWTPYKSVLKPIGQSFASKTDNTDKGEVFETTLEPAIDDENFQKVKVMGDEDWEDRICFLVAEKLLAPNAETMA